MIVFFSVLPLLPKIFKAVSPVELVLGGGIVVAIIFINKSIVKFTRFL